MHKGKEPASELLMSFQQAVEELPLEALPKLLGVLEQVKATAWTRIHCGQPQAGESNELMTVPQVAAKLKISQYRAYELLRTGQIRATRLGRSVRVKPSDLDDYLAGRGA